MEKNKSNTQKPKKLSSMKLWLDHYGIDTTEINDFDNDQIDPDYLGGALANNSINNLLNKRALKQSHR